MITFESTDIELPDALHPISLTIGTFDGLHLGHQTIIKEMQGTKVVITFTNHPHEVVKPGRELELLMTIDEKVEQLEKLGVDYLYLIDFTKEFSEQTPSQFVKSLRETIPFDYLVLGEDAKIGKDRSGTKEVIRSLAFDLGFEAKYVPHLTIDGQRPSSSLIRRLIKEDKISEAEALLGRSIMS